MAAVVANSSGPQTRSNSAPSVAAEAEKAAEAAEAAKAAEAAEAKVLFFFLSFFFFLFSFSFICFIRRACLVPLDLTNLVRVETARRSPARVPDKP